MELRTVTVLGAGLIGTSIGLALTRGGVRVRLADPDADALAGAVRRGAGVALTPGAEPGDVAIVATPAATVAAVLADAIERGLGVAYTDVAAVKGDIVAAVSAAGCDLGGYVPGHPVVAGELGDSVAVDADLFAGRSWFLCPLSQTAAAAVAAVEAVVTACGGLPAHRTPDDHDQHMALAAHVPRLLAAATAAQFDHTGDVIRPLLGSRFTAPVAAAGNDAARWADAIVRNGGPVADALEKLTAESAAVVSALRTDGMPQPAVRRLLAAADRGRLRTSRDGAASGGTHGVPGPEVEWFWVR